MPASPTSVESSSSSASQPEVNMELVQLFLDASFNGKVQFLMHCGFPEPIANAARIRAHIEVLEDCITSSQLHMCNPLVYEKFCLRSIPDEIRSMLISESPEIPAEESEYRCTSSTNLSLNLETDSS